MHFRLFQYHDALGEKSNSTYFLNNFFRIINSNTSLKNSDKVQTKLKILELKACYPARIPPESEEQNQEVEKLERLLDYFTAQNNVDWMVVCHNRLGLTMLRNKKVEMAIEHFEKALTYNNTFDFLQGNLAVCFFERGEIQKATEGLLFSNQLALANNNHYTLAVNKITLGLIKIVENDLESARQILE